MGNCFQQTDATSASPDNRTQERLVKLERELETLQNQLSTTTKQLSVRAQSHSDQRAKLLPLRSTATDEDDDEDEKDGGYDVQFGNGLLDAAKDGSFASNANDVNLDRENAKTMQLANMALMNARRKQQHAADAYHAPDADGGSQSPGAAPGASDSGFLCVTTPGGLVVPMHERNIAVSSLERYTGCALTGFQPLLLVTNFPDYITLFAEHYDTTVCKGSSWSCAHCVEKGISMINYNMGSPNAALLVDIVARIELFKMVLFVGMVGGVSEKYEIGDFFVPMAAVREEQTSNYYLKPNIPAIPDIDLLRAILNAIEKHPDVAAWEGVVYTMNIRFWEFDPKMKKYLERSQAHAIDMETATLFVASMRRKLKLAAFHLVSDLPLKAVKDKAAAKRIIQSLGKEHVIAACEVLQQALEYKSHRDNAYEERIKKRESLPQSGHGNGDKAVATTAEHVST